MRPAATTIGMSFGVQTKDSVQMHPPGFCLTLFSWRCRQKALASDIPWQHIAVTTGPATATVVRIGESPCARQRQSSRAAAY